MPPSQGLLSAETQAVAFGSSPGETNSLCAGPALREPRRPERCTTPPPCDPSRYRISLLPHPPLTRNAPPLSTNPTSPFPQEELHNVHTRVVLAHVLGAEEMLVQLLAPQGCMSAAPQVPQPRTVPLQ